MTEEQIVENINQLWWRVPMALILGTAVFWFVIRAIIGNPPELTLTHCHNCGDLVSNNDRVIVHTSSDSRSNGNKVCKHCWLTKFKKLTTT